MKAELSDKIQPITGERQRGETDNAVIACNDWLRMGVGRSLTGLLEKYTETIADNPPTASMATLKSWSRKFTWAERATRYDAEYEQIKQQQRAAVMHHGAALDFERVAKLKRLAAFLESQIFDPGEDGSYPNVWLADVKQIGGGEFAERVDLEKFNGALISEYRGVLDDIAKEVGGRIRKAEADVTSGGQPLQGATVNVAIQDLAELSDDELENLAGNGASGTAAPESA